MQEVAIAQLEEGNELIMSLEVLGEEPMKLCKTTLAQQMAEKAYDATKVNMEESVPRGLQATLENIFGTGGPSTATPSRI